MMKKILKSLSLVMALVMCFCMVFTGAVSAEGTVALALGDTQTVAPGATVTIEVTGANFDNVAGVQGKIDATALTDVSVTAGTFENVTVADGIVSFAQEGDKPQDSDNLVLEGGVLFTISATAPETEGTYTVKWVESSVKACNTAETVLDTTATGVDIVVAAATTGPVLDENITVTGIITVDSTVDISFTVANVADYASFDLSVTRDSYNVSTYNKETVTANATYLTEYNNIHFLKSSGYALVDMALDVSAVVNCYDEAGNKVAYSAPFTTTIKTLATELYNRDTTPVATKTMLTDLLNMGTEAQKYFAGRYASSTLATDVADGKLANADFDQTYATAELGTPVVGEGQTVNNGATVVANGSVLLSATLGYIVTPDATPSNLSISISFENKYTEKTVTKDDTFGDPYNGMYFYSYSELPLYSTNAVVTANVYDGETLLGTNTYTVDQWVDANKNSESIGAIATAIGKFGISARTYFNIA